MTSERITRADLDRALAAHVDCLARVGITYDGRLGLDEGSKTYGRAYRLYLTAVPWPCQDRRYRDMATGELYRYREDAPTGHETQRAHDWDHAECEHCHGTKVETNTGHHRPPVGDDFLGMTAREAYQTLTTRTRAIYDTAAAMEGR